MRELYGKIADTYFAVATCLLLLIAVLLLFGAVWEMIGALLHGDVLKLLDGVGLIIIGFAIIETSNSSPRRRFCATRNYARRWSRAVR